MLWSTTTGWKAGMNACRRWWPTWFGVGVAVIATPASTEATLAAKTATATIPLCSAWVRTR